jgi:K+-sensing histidine kinase KdpD
LASPPNRPSSSDLLPILISAILFGFATSLFGVIDSIAAADFFFAPPVFDFQITEWEDVLGLAAFGIIGALVALAPGSTSS